jgi:O-methyltransferase involved in polyketide biosynthesis
LDKSGPGLWTNLACRKHHIDDKLDESIGSADVVVILGAGLDTRPYRLVYAEKL